MGERFENLGVSRAPAKLGLMGGTFDPIHIGHLRVAEEVREALGLDGVLFIPTGNPVFKRDQEVTDAHVRFEQVRCAIAGNPHFDVSAIEVERGGDTYTVDTLRELHELYPEGVEFYFIVGSDAAATIGKWRGVDEIARLTHLVVAAGRPGSPSADELRATILAVAPFDLHVVDVSALEISSSDIRDRVKRGRSARYLTNLDGRLLTPSSLFDREGDASALTKAFFKVRKAELERRVRPKRFEHSLAVSKTCVELAELYDVDVKKARLAGLLHDWDKGFDDEGARLRVYELGMEDEIDPWIVENMPHVLHGNTAARALGRDFPEIPGDVLQAIDRHTTAATDMTPLDMVLYVADAIEPGRRYGRIEELRSAVGEVPLDELYFQTYEYWVFLLFERGKPLHPDTIRIWNDYTMKHPRKKEKRKK